MSSKQSQRPWLQADKIQGLLFDGAMLFANLYLLGSLAETRLEDFTDQNISAWLAVGLLTQLFGAILKKGPLQQRIIDRQLNQKEDRDNIMGCLSFIHFIFFIVVAAMALALTGLIDFNASLGISGFFWLTIIFAIAGLVTGSVWLAVRSPKSEESQGNWFPYQELLGNLLLWLSAAILTRFFWTGLLIESGPPSFAGFSSRAFVYLSATSVLFMIFYVPARLLFLAEDYKYPLTWLRLWLVAMLPLLLLVF